MLTITGVKWLADRVTLIFYTNNPLTIDEKNMRMPFSRRLLASPTLLNSFTRLKISETTKTSILPTYPVSGPLTLSYDLDNPEFYSSYMYQNSSFLLEITGALFVLILFVKYSVKALITVPESLNPGNIIPHILAFKVGAILLYPTYLEYVQFCSGFMYADFPWLNSVFGEAMANESDLSPMGYRVFYVNMNIASMYFLACIMILLLAGLTVAIGKKMQK